jgi:exonuclease III
MAVSQATPFYPFPMNKILWKVLNWNVRGLNDPDKWTLIFNKIRESGCQVICFQESKKEQVDLAFIKKICPMNFDSFAFVPSIGRSGGIITIWNSSVFSGVEVFQNRYALPVELHATKSEVYWTLTNIYAPCVDNEQFQFLQWIHNIHIPADENYMMVGDFNLIRSPQDRNRPGGNVNEMLLFNEAISQVGLLHIPLKGRKYTWSNMQSSPLLQRLDWFFCSLAWGENFPNTVAHSLAMTTSNHVPCVITIETTMPKSNIFIFENNWLEMEGFLPLVELTWTHFHIYTIQMLQKELQQSSYC